MILIAYVTLVQVEQLGFNDTCVKLLSKKYVEMYESLVEICLSEKRYIFKTVQDILFKIWSHNFKASVFNFSIYVWS